MTLQNYEHMSNHFKIPKANPFWFIKATATPGVHFDDDWACAQIKSYEATATYRQKWLRAKTTPIQVESSIAPQDLKVLDQNGDDVKTIAWAVVFTGVSYSIYEAEVDFSDLPEGVYYLYVAAVFEAINWPAITEPIHVRDSWDNLLEYRYYNTFNDFDVAWTTGIQMRFFCESAIKEFTPDRDRTSYVNQVRDTATLKATPGRSFKLWIAEGGGVAEWVVDLLNRIFCCDRIVISDKEYQSADGSKWEVSRVKGYPLVGATIDIVEAKNLMSLEYADTTPLTPGIVAAYEIETDFFGPGSTVPVIDVEENS